MLAVAFRSRVAVQMTRNRTVPRRTSRRARRSSSRFRRKSGNWDPALSRYSITSSTSPAATVASGSGFHFGHAAGSWATSSHFASSSPPPQPGLGRPRPYRPRATSTRTTLPGIIAAIFWRPAPAPALLRARMLARIEHLDRKRRPLTLNLPPRRDHDRNCARRSAPNTTPGSAVAMRELALDRTRAVAFDNEARPVERELRRPAIDDHIELHRISSAARMRRQALRGCPSAAPAAAFGN